MNVGSQLAVKTWRALLFVVFASALPSPLRQQQWNTRNVAIIAHVDHGKTTLSDSLLLKAGLIAKKKAGNACVMDTMDAEQERGITIKCSSITLSYSLADLDTQQLQDTWARNTGESAEPGSWLKELRINLIDSPGHVDFNGEVTSALRITDGAVLVVDCVEGVCVQTETVIQQAMAERVRVVLVLNKVDRLILELHLAPEEALHKFLLPAIQRVNEIIGDYQDPAMGDMRVSLESGTVALCSAVQGWGFTLSTFVRMYSSKGLEPAKLWAKLKGSRSSEVICDMVLKPVWRLVESAVEGGSADVTLKRRMDALGLTLTSEEWKLQGSKFVAAIMTNWLPAADAVVQMMAHELPSPVAAQAYRTQHLYMGEQDEPVAVAMRECDADGPIMMFVSKMVPMGVNKQIVAFGRLFSGTITSGCKVRVMSPEYERGGEDGVTHCKVMRVVLNAGISRFEQNLDKIAAGQTCAIMGVEHALVKTGSLTSAPDAAGLKVLKFSVSSVVQAAVRPKSTSDLTKMVDALKGLCKQDPMLQYSFDSQTQEHIMAATGELHLEVSMNELNKLVECTQSPPVITFRESIVSASTMSCFTKSTNKHNRITITAEPLEPELLQAMERGDMCRLSANALEQYLRKQFRMPAQEARRVWGVGETEEVPCMIVDKSSGVQTPQGARGAVVNAFHQVCNSGVLVREKLRGVKFNILDMLWHSDPIHFSGAQVTPMAVRAMWGALRASGLVLQEPIFKVEVTTPESALGSAYGVISSRRGEVASDELQHGTVHLLKGFLPVKESFGFCEALRAASSGRAFPQCTFSHWANHPGDPLQEGSAAATVTKQIRQRKKVPVEVPTVESFIDRL